MSKSAELFEKSREKEFIQSFLTKEKQYFNKTTQNNIKKGR